MAKHGKLITIIVLNTMTRQIRRCLRTNTYGETGDWSQSDRLTAHETHNVGLEGCTSVNWDLTIYLYVIELFFVIWLLSVE